jgi:hypothetical protein
MHAKLLSRVTITLTGESDANNVYLNLLRVPAFHAQHQRSTSRRTLPACTEVRACEQSESGAGARAGN